MSELSNFDVYAAPDEENGPLSEVSPAERQTEYDRARAAWLRLPIGERMELEEFLRRNGVDVALLDSGPAPTD